MAANTISHYEVLDLLAEGGMGAVYRAVDVRLGRPVALKLLHAESAANGDSRKRFMQEARAASALNHPNIITIYDIGRERVKVAGEPEAEVDFIAMEYVAGSPLTRIIERKKVDVVEALDYAIQIADALATAHAAGIVHRDLKPANIMVGDKGSIKVVDFGVAKLIEHTGFASVGDTLSTQSVRSGDLQTAQGTILGTAAYMSPEQAEGKPADARSDVFSFGAVLYEMITGRRAFRGDTKISTLAAILTRDPEPPSRAVPELPRDLEKLIARCLRKDPDRRWQSMADLKVALEEVLEEYTARDVTSPPIVASRRWRWAVAASAALVLVAVLIVFNWRAREAPAQPPPRPSLTKLTSDVGWTDHPAISPDGRFLAYASDRSGEGHLDIWVQQIPGGSPHRLTFDAADDRDPSFSADGTRIAFESTRQEAGIYVLPTLGGEERLVAARGFSPRFSPDGKWLAYGRSEHGTARIDVVPASGGPALRIAGDFALARAPVWSPDGRYLLFWGQRRRAAPPDNNVDWYLASLSGEPPRSMGARARLLESGFETSHGLPLPEAWVRDGSRVLFHGHVGDSWNMWQIPISVDSGQVGGAPQQATFGTTDEAAASTTPDGRMVFISRTMGADIWNLPIDADRARVHGPLTRVTEDAADDYDPTLSADGSTMVFRSRKAGRFDIVLKKLATGTETLLMQTEEDDYPAVSPDGTRIAYSVRTNGKSPIFVVAAGGGTPEQVCDDCGELEQWSPDGERLLYVTSHDPSGVGLLKLPAARNDEWLRHPGYGIYNARLSRDGRWVVFNARNNRLAPARVFVAPVDEAGVAPERAWIDVGVIGDAPAWSPGASLLYFWSDRDGSPCLWAQALDPSTKRPSAAPVSIQHFHRRGLSWKNLYLGAPDIAVARDRIVFNLGEHSGNIWMTELPPLR